MTTRRSNKQHTRSRNEEQEEPASIPPVVKNGLIILLIFAILKPLKFIILGLPIMIILWLIAGTWPPIYLVESQSMMHGTDSELGVIDTGDYVMVKSVNPSEITTWVDHKEINYGTYGDVIVYRMSGGSTTPVIHRAVVWLEVNLSKFDKNTLNGASYDIPSMKLFGQTGRVTIQDYPEFQGGNGKITLTIELGDLLLRAKKMSLEPRSGYITKGDNNGNQLDQFYLTDERSDTLIGPIRPERIIGTVEGEIPTASMVFCALTFIFLNILDFAVAIGIFALGKSVYRKHKEKAEKEKEKNKGRRRGRTSRV